MNLFARNVLAVLLLRPTEFVEPTPHALRAAAAAAAGSALALAMVLPAEAVAPAVLAGLLVLALPALQAPRSYGTRSPWRGIFALYVAAAPAALLNAIVDSPWMTLLSCVYVCRAVSLQAARAPSADNASPMHDRQTVLEARQALSGMNTAGGLAAVWWKGALEIASVGPAVGRLKEQDIPEWLVDVHGQRWIFGSVSSPDAVADMGPHELYMAPGLLYRLEAARPADAVPPR